MATAHSSFLSSPARPADYRMIQQAMLDMEQMFQLLGTHPALQVGGGGGDTRMQRGLRVHRAGASRQAGWDRREKRGGRNECTAQVH